MPRNAASRTYQRTTVTAQPLKEPVTLDEVKAYARITQDSENGLINSWIKAARIAVENFTGRKLIEQTLTAFLDQFPAGSGSAWWSGTRQGTPESTGLSSNRSIILDYLPLKLGDPAGAVTQVSTFSDADVESVFPADGYLVDNHSQDQQGRISLKSGASWPTDLRDTSAIKIEYVVGYGTEPTDVPEDIRLCIMSLVAYWYKQREAACSVSMSEVPLQFHWMVNQYRVHKDL